MIQLLLVRDAVKKFYSRYARIINVILRFLAALNCFTLLNTEIGYDERILDVPVVLLLSGVSAFFPLSFMVFVAFLMTVIHIYAASGFLSGIFILIIAVLYFLLIRFAPGYGWVVLAVPVCSAVHMGALVPIVLGLIGTPIAVFALIPGTVVYYLIGVIKSAISISDGSTKLQDNLQNYIYVIKQLTGNREMILMLVASTLIMLITYFTRRLMISHANETAVIVGGLSYIIFMIFGYLAFDVSTNVLWMLAGAILAALGAYVVQFARFILDYSAVEHLQFDDDDYYYYVTAIPKYSVTGTDKEITRISDSDADRE